MFFRSLEAVFRDGTLKLCPLVRSVPLVRSCARMTCYYSWGGERGGWGVEGATLTHA